MNREIKFKAWDSQHKMMIYGGFVPVCHDDDCGLISGDNDEKGDWIDYTLMQFTGLLDKNDKEIYEGDVLSRLGDKPAPGGGYFGGTSGYHERSIVTVRKDGAAMLRDTKILSEELNFFGSREPASGYKVIGNIYENPELVEA